MEVYLEDNRPTLDEICETFEGCTEECPGYGFCHYKTESGEIKYEYGRNENDTYETRT